MGKHYLFSRQEPIGGTRSNQTPVPQLGSFNGQVGAFLPSFCGILTVSTAASPLRVE